MTRDKNKNITPAYNILNLPQTINIKGVIGADVYIYDASGTKLRKINSVGSNVTSTDYIDGIQYDATTASPTPAVTFVQTEEGRARWNAGTSNYRYEYDLKDHLGDTRVTFYDDGTGKAQVAQLTNYYPFGATIGSLSPGLGYINNHYLYNHKELQDETNLYDYGARLYDPVIGRWTTVDPLATNHSDLTPYSYVMNNPVLYIDEFGLDTGKVKVVKKPLQEVKVVAIKTKKNEDPVGTNLFHHSYKPAPVQPCNCPVLHSIMALATTYLIMELFPEEDAVENALTDAEIIQFGQNENQITHAIRHLEDEGLTSEEIEDVKSAIKNDLSKAGEQIKAGAPVTPKTITVDGVKIQYNAFRLNNGVINVGRITILK